MKKLNLCVIALLSGLCLFGCRNDNQVNEYSSTITEDNNHIINENKSKDFTFEIESDALRVYHDVVNHTPDCYLKILEYNYITEQNNKDLIVIMNIKFDNYNGDKDFVNYYSLSMLSSLLATYLPNSNLKTVLNAYDENGNYISSATIEYVDGARISEQYE